MKTQTDKHEINQQLTFQDAQQTSITLHALTLTLTQQNSQLIASTLTLTLPPQTYQHIDNNALFNLNPSLRLPLTNGNFHPSPNIQIEAILKPEFLPHLQPHATTAETAATYLANLDSSTPNPLLNTENWLALSVTQVQETGETGYRTFWSYLTPEALSLTDTSGEQLSQGVAQFFQDIFGSSFEAATENFTNESLAAISDVFQGINLNVPEVAPPQPSAKQPILQAILSFFTEDDWSFQKITSEPAVRLAFEGENGKWNCYAKAREEQQQMVFYSLCPVVVPSDKRRAAAELIARANYGLIVGNFELDFKDGEIRYKTSIDVEGESLNSNLIKPLVYANVMMMDEYLPAIEAVVEGKLSPEEAISSLE
ncbi:MAG: YbjN domain-containing protein [Cyanobacteriota bacterium]|nr:YbjN domain-containing protein [Cyanobacteriota bacterium]